MRLPAGIKKWGREVLGVVVLLLLGNLVVQIRGAHAGVARPHAAASRAAAPLAARSRTEKAKPHVADDLAGYDPVVHFEILEGLDTRPLPDLDRNLFDFVTPPAPVVAPQPVAAVLLDATPPLPLLPPPPPPPVLLKPVGYNGMPGGGKAAMTTLDDQAYLVREGDVVAARYKILKITTANLTVEDATTHQTVDLPFPQ